MSNNSRQLKILHTLRPLKGSSSPLAGCASSRKPSWVDRPVASHSNTARLSGMDGRLHCLTRRVLPRFQPSMSGPLTVEELHFTRSFPHQEIRQFLLRLRGVVATGRVWDACTILSLLEFFSRLSDQSFNQSFKSYQRSLNVSHKNLKTISQFVFSHSVFRISTVKKIIVKG